MEDSSKRELVDPTSVMVEFLESGSAISEDQVTAVLSYAIRIGVNPFESEETLRRVLSEARILQCFEVPPPPAAVFSAWFEEALDIPRWESVEKMRAFFRAKPGKIFECFCDLTETMLKEKLSFRALDDWLLDEDPFSQEGSLSMVIRSIEADLMLRETLTRVKGLDDALEWFQTCIDQYIFRLISLLYVATEVDAGEADAIKVFVYDLIDRLKKVGITSDGFLERLQRTHDLLEEAVMAVLEN